VKLGDKTDAGRCNHSRGVLSHASGKVPAAGDKIDLADHALKLLEANQRKCCDAHSQAAEGCFLQR